MKLRAILPVRHLGLILGALTLPALTLSAQSAERSIAAIPANTAVAIRTIDRIDSKGSASDKEYRATVDDSVVVGDVTVAPVGTPAFLRVMQIQQAGAVSGRAAVSLRLIALEVNGKRVALDTGNATIHSGSQAAKATRTGIGGAVAGGILGGLLGGKSGAARGAAVGTAAGVTAAVVMGQQVHVPVETRLSFTLATDAAIAEHEATATATSPIGLTAGQAPTTSPSTDATSTGPLIPVNTVVAIRTVDLIDSDGSATGREYRATVDDSVVVAGVTVAPVGTPAFLRVVQVQQAGAVKGRAVVSLRLSALEIAGQRVSVETGGATIRSGSQAAKATKAGAGGAIVGGILGGLLGGKGGAAQGVAAGAAVGVTAAAINGQKVHVPAETRLSFTVTGPPTAAGRPDSDR